MSREGQAVMATCQLPHALRTGKVGSAAPSAPGDLNMLKHEGPTQAG